MRCSPHSPTLGQHNPIPGTAEAVLYALCVPENVQISEIMLRPLQPLQMPGLRLPA